MPTKEQIKEWNEAAVKGTMDDSDNPIFVFSMTSTQLLVKFLSRELDVSELMKYELSNRGLNEQGAFVGFNQKTSNERTESIR